MSPNTRKTLSFLAIEFSFFLAMWLSKTAWPLWFCESGDLRVYGFSYSVMACTGIFSIVFSSAIKKLGLRRALMLGLSLYGCGIALRWYNRSMGAGIVSGLSGGVGASIVLLTLRIRAWEFQETAVSPKFISARKAVKDVASGLAGILIAALIAFSGYRLAMFSALIPLLVAFYLGSRMKEPEKKAAPATATAPSGLNRLCAIPKLRALLLLSLVGGLYSSLSVPYLPMLYRDIGMSAKTIPLLASLATVVSLLSQPLAIYLCNRARPISAFFMGEIVYLVALALLVFAKAPFMIPFLVALRVSGRSVSGLAEEMIELSAVSKAETVAFYGAVQTAFLIGDSAGGFAGGLVIGTWGIRSVFVISMGFVVLHVLGMLLTFRVKSVPSRVLENAS